MPNYNTIPASTLSTDPLIQYILAQLVLITARLTTIDGIGSTTPLIPCNIVSLTSAINTQRLDLIQIAHMYEGIIDNINNQLSVIQNQINTLN